MSNRRKLRPQTTVPSALDSMTGKRMPGGCDDCHAYQTVTKQATGVYVLAVCHDSTCPTFRGITA